MAFQFVTVQSIVDQIEYRSNNDGYEQRHPEATIAALWNISWQELREMVSFLEDGTFLKQTSPATFASAGATTAVSGEDYAQLDWPAGAVSIFGVRVKTTERWRALRPLPVAALHDYQYDGLWNSQSRSPIGYILQQIPYGDTTNERAGKIMIVPVPSSGSFSVWYLEAWTPITDLTYKVSGHAAWIEWSVWDTVIKMRAKDGQQDATYRIAVEERERCRQRIEERASRLSDGLSMEPRNARGDGGEPDPYRWEDF
jgi:hypothetical protein